MAEIQKFIFDNNYSTSAENIKKIQDKKFDDARILLKQEVEQAKQEAYNQGVQLGEKQALEKLELELNTHVEHISNNISSLEQYKKELHKIFEQQALLTVRHLTNQMFFKSEEIFADKLLQQAIENSLNNLPFTTKIVIKIPNACREYLNDIDLETKIKNKGVSDFTIIEDNSLNNGECEICWDKSGLLSSKKESLLKINTTLDNFLNNEDIELSEETKKTESEIPSTEKEENEIAITEESTEVEQNSNSEEPTEANQTSQ